MEGVAVSDKVGQIDDEIRRLHAQAKLETADELARVVAASQIDELLEQRHKLTSSGSPRKRGADSSRL